MNKMIPVIYYDLSTTDFDTICRLSEGLTDYFKKENIMFIFLPKDLMELKYMDKEDVLKMINNIKEEVEKWD